ncbi:lipopolysaccharide biosynthesis protein [Aurantivibrio infirmus]
MNEKPILKIFGKNTSIAILDQAILSATNFAINVLLIRYLPIDEFGVYVIVFSLLLFVSSVQAALVCSPLIVIVPQRKERLGENFIGSIFYGYAFLCFSIVCLIQLSHAMSKFGFDWVYDSTLVNILSVTSVFYLGQLFIRSVLLSKFRFLSALINDLIISSLQILFIIILVKAESLEINSIFLSLSFSAFASFIYGLFQCRRYLKSPKSSRVLIDCIRNLNHGKWLLGSNLIGWSRTNIINYAALFMLGPVAPAVIRTLQTIFGPLNLGLLSMESVIPQYCSRLYLDRGFSALASAIVKVSFFALALVVFYYIVVVSFGPLILRSFFGEKYVEYSSLVWLVGVQYLFIVLQIVSTIVLRVIEKPKSIFKISAMEFLLTLIPGILLINYIELEGVILWKIASSVVLSIGLLLVCLKLGKQFRGFGNNIL